MKLDIRKCNALRQYDGDLTFTFEGDNALIDIPTVVFSTPVTAQLHYEIREDNCVEITGGLRFSLKGECSRCLSETEQQFSGEVDALFTPGKSDGETYSYRNGILDLDEVLRDSLLFALPRQLLCSETCLAPEYNES